MYSQRKPIIIMAGIPGWFAASLLGEPLCSRSRGGGRSSRCLCPPPLLCNVVRSKYSQHLPPACRGMTRSMADFRLGLKLADKVGGGGPKGGGRRNWRPISHHPCKLAGGMDGRNSVTGKTVTSRDHQPGCFWRSKGLIYQEGRSRYQ